MSWAQENKFLTGLIAVTVVGAGVLGYLTYDAMGKHEEATQRFDQLAAEKKRLETLPVYPNAENLKKVQQQREEHAGRIAAIQNKLNSMELPEEAQISPEGFQDRLRTSVTAYAKSAAEARMKLPERFYLGFDPYQSATPRGEAVPKLARQLKAIEFILQQLVQTRTYELKKITRQELPEETGRPRVVAATPAPKGGSNRGGNKPAAPEPAPLVNRELVEINFVSEQTALQKIINALTTAKNQFYVVRNLSVKNEKPNPPSRETAQPTEFTPAVPPPDAAPPADGTAPAEAAASATPAQAPKSLEFIVGEEKIDVTLTIEIVDFAEPVVADAKPNKQK